MVAFAIDCPVYFITFNSYTYYSPIYTKTFLYSVINTYSLSNILAFPVLPRMLAQNYPMLYILQESRTHYLFFRVVLAASTRKATHSGVASPRIRVVATRRGADIIKSALSIINYC